MHKFVCASETYDLIFNAFAYDRKTMAKIFLHIVNLLIYRYNFKNWTCIDWKNMVYYYKYWIDRGGDSQNGVKVSSFN